MFLAFVGCLQILACSCLPAGQGASAKKSDAKPIVSDGAFSAPNRRAGSEPRPKGARSKGRFQSPELRSAAAGHPKALILVDILETDEATSRASAERMAREWGGKVLDEKTTLDGVEASRVQYAKPKSGCRPIEGVLAIKGGKLYIIMGCALSPGTSVTDQLEEVRKGWKWVK